MERFLHRQNLQRYRELLTRVTDETQRLTILNLLSSEEEKDENSKIAKQAEFLPRAKS